MTGMPRCASQVARIWPTGATAPLSNRVWPCAGEQRAGLPHSELGNHEHPRCPTHADLRKQPSQWVGEQLEGGAVDHHWPSHLAQAWHGSWSTTSSVARGRPRASVVVQRSDHQSQKKHPPHAPHGSRLIRCQTIPKPRASG